MTTPPTTTVATEIASAFKTGGVDRLFMPDRERPAPLGRPAGRKHQDARRSQRT